VFEQLINKLLRRGASKQAAKSRLHFVLVQDRSGLTNEELSTFKRELVDVIKRYFMLDEEGIEIDYQRDFGETTLVINSPVLRRRLSDKSSSDKSNQEAAKGAGLKKAANGKMNGSKSHAG